MKQLPVNSFKVFAFKKTSIISDNVKVIIRKAMKVVKPLYSHIAKKEDHLIGRQKPEYLKTLNASEEVYLINK